VLRAGAEQLNKVSTLAELKPVILGIAWATEHTDDAFPTTGRRHDPALRPLSWERRVR
jgi:hypothetical protein